MNSRLSLCLGMTAALVAGSALAADWPVFRGNALQTGVATSALPARLEILWQHKTKDAIEGTAAIVDGTAYIASFDEMLYAFDLASGIVRWTYKAGPCKTPVSVRGGKVYIGNLDGLFHCVDGSTGKKVWAFETMAEITSGASFLGETVIFGSGDETMYCLEKDGKLRWKFRVPGGPVMGTPAIVGDRTFAAGCDSALHVLDARTGKEIAAPLELGGQVGASLAVDGDRLFVGNMTGQALAIDWKKGEVLWTFESPRVKQPFYSSAALTDRLVVIGSRDKRVYALDRKTGKEVWNFAARKKIDGSPVVVGTRVYIGGSDGNLYVLDLETGKEVQSLTLGNEILGSPAVAGGRLVIGTADGTVYCLGSKAS